MQPNQGMQAPPVPLQQDPALTARLTQLCAADQVVADAVTALNAAHATPLAVALLDTPVGSGYSAATNLIVLSTKYAAPNLGSIAGKLILYRLTCGLFLLNVDVTNPVALQAFNTRQEYLWRLANPTPAPAPAHVRRFYQGTNRENYYLSNPCISIAGLDPNMAGSGIGCKRWERHIVTAEHKDQGWHTITLSFEVALSYARQHTEWAMGMKENEPALWDVEGYGGLVLSFDVPVAHLVNNDRWRQDRSGDNNNFQTQDAIAAAQIQVVEELAIPGPLTKVAPPPTAAQMPVVQRQPNTTQGSGNRRRVYPATPSTSTNQT